MCRECTKKKVGGQEHWEREARRIREKTESTQGCVIIVKKLNGSCSAFLSFLLHSIHHLTSPTLLYRLCGLKKVNAGRTCNYKVGLDLFMYLYYVLYFWYVNIKLYMLAWVPTMTCVYQVVLISWIYLNFFKVGIIQSSFCYATDCLYRPLKLV